VEDLREDEVPEGWGWDVLPPAELVEELGERFEPFVGFTVVAAWAAIDDFRGDHDIIRTDEALRLMLRCLASAGWIGSGTSGDDTEWFWVTPELSKSRGQTISDQVIALERALAGAIVARAEAERRVDAAEAEHTGCADTLAAAKAEHTGCAATLEEAQVDASEFSRLQKLEVALRELLESADGDVEQLVRVLVDGKVELSEVEAEKLAAAVVLSAASTERYRFEIEFTDPPPYFDAMVAGAQRAGLAFGILIGTKQVPKS